MPLYTEPNQRIIHINKEPLSNNFLAVNKPVFQEAYRDLNATATILWLYLAANRSGFDLAFSPQAVFNQIGMPTTTCRDQVKKLIEKGYLVPKSEGSNVYDFYEKPRTSFVSADNSNGSRNDSNGSRCEMDENRPNKAAEIREIYNNSDADKINIEWRF